MPKITLELTLGRRRTLEGRKGTLLHREVNTRLLSRKLDILKDLAIESTSLLGGPRNAELGKDIRKTLHTNTNRAMACVRVATLLRGLEVDINDLVQIACENLGDQSKCLKVERIPLHKPRKTD